MDINEIRKQLDILSEEMKSPDFNADKKENSTREITLREYERLSALIYEYENELNLIEEKYPAGTISYGVEFNLEYIEVISNNKSLELPPIRKCMIVKNDNIKSLNQMWEDSIIYISDKTNLSKGILGKLEGVFIINTSTGYIKIEITY